jgi:hypothetical protein
MLTTRIQVNSVTVMVGGRETSLYPVHYLRSEQTVIPNSKAKFYSVGNVVVSKQARWVFASTQSLSIEIYKYELYAAMTYNCYDNSGKVKTRRLLVSGSRLFFVKNTLPPAIEESWVLMGSCPCTASRA